MITRSFFTEGIQWEYSRVRIVTLPSQSVSYYRRSIPGEAGNRWA